MDYQEEVFVSIAPDALAGCPSDCFERLPKIPSQSQWRTEATGDESKSKLLRELADVE
jgi:hypothetical protein